MDRQEALKRLEADVSSIKDPELRKIAFEKLLVQEFSEPDKKKSKKRAKAKGKEKRRKTARGKTHEYYSTEKVRDDIKKLNLTGKIKSLPLFRVCGEVWEKCLWVLAAAKKMRIDGLNNHEIAYILSKRLYRNTKYSTVNNIRKKVSTGLVTFDPEDFLWRITPDGVDHIANLDKNKSKIPKHNNK